MVMTLSLVVTAMTTLKVGLEQESSMEGQGMTPFMAITGSKLMVTLLIQQVSSSMEKMVMILSFSSIILMKVLDYHFQT